MWIEAGVGSASGPQRFDARRGLAIVFPSPGGGTVWGNVIVMILGCSAPIAALTSRAMREHVSSQRRQQPVRPTGF
jgi:hypothetical protein